MSKGRIPRDKVVKLVEPIFENLQAACSVLEWAGSVRRMAPTVADAELVVIPKPGDLFGIEGDPGHVVKAFRKMRHVLVAPGRCCGPRLQSWRVLHDGVDQGFALEVYLVRKETFAVQLAIRTGPREFSRSLVTVQSAGGRLPDGLCVCDGQVQRAIAPGRWRPITGIDSERDFLELCGGWVEPHDRK